MTDLKEQWLLSFPSGLKWFNTLKSKYTKSYYIDYLKRYCDAVEKTPEELIQLKVNGLKLTGENGEFQAEDLLEDFFAKCECSKNAKLNLRNAVISFYKWNRRPLNPTTALNVKDIPTPKKNIPLIEDILELENNVTTQRDKALIWFLASTAVRIGTLTSLTWRDLKPTNNPEVPFLMEIEAERLKGSGMGKYKGIRQVCFIHKHAYEKLEAYRKEAELKGYSFKESDNIFIAYYQANKNSNKGLTRKGITQLFDSASLRAWKDLDKKRFSPHKLRGFVQSALESAGIQEAIISPILAHKVKGIAQSYSQHTVNELLENFVKAIPYLSPKTVSALETELKNTEAKFTTQQTQINDLEKAIEGLYHVQRTYPQTIKHELINRKTGKYEEYTETVNNPQEEKESLMRFQEKLKKLSEPLKDNEEKQVFET